jgi:hypothetical protein
MICLPTLTTRRWSLPTGERVVPSGWRATVGGEIGWVSHALVRLLQPARHRSAGPSLRRVVLSRRSSVLRPAPTPFALPVTSVWPYTRASFRGDRRHRRVREGLPSSSTGLHCMPSPIRRSGSEVLQNHGLGLLPSPKPAGLGPLDPLRVSTFDAAEFAFATACSFASPRFDARVSPDAGG